MPSKLYNNVRVTALILTTAVTDVSPPWMRYGVGLAIRRRLLERELITFGSPSPSTIIPMLKAAIAQSTIRSNGRVLLVTRGLGVGGVETIVATLAQLLPGFGIQVEVLCSSLGPTADRLRAAGISVTELPDTESAVDHFSRIPPETVAQLHNAPDYLIDACLERQIRIVQVIHNTDINLDQEDWKQEHLLAGRAEAVVAVSDTVRKFYLYNLPGRIDKPVEVLHNGADISDSSLSTREARKRLSDTLGVELGGSILISCLARYDMQKNLPGLVASFLEATKMRNDVHLVIAGPVGDWLDFALAEAIRRAHPGRNKVHLLGPGNSSELLRASDAFILDSFFEGWPVAATEAVLSGLPILLPELGGAKELVGPSRARGITFGNPATRSPELISYRDIRHARRRPLRQRNRHQLVAAVRSLCSDIERWREKRAALQLDAEKWLSASSMAARHAELLLGVIERESND